MNKYEKRAKLLKDMRALVDANPTMNADDVEKYNKMEAEYDKLDAEIKREEALAKREAEAKEPTSKPLTGDVTPGMEKFEDKAYMEAFNAYLKGESPDKYRNAMTVGSDPDGGYIVPETYQRSVLMKLNSIGRTRSISNVITTTSTHNIPVEGEPPTFAWVSEGGAYGETSATFGTLQIGAWKLGGIIKVSEELLQDNMINFDQYMAGQIAKGIDKGESPAFAIGDGVSKPTGYLTGATVGANSTTATAGAVTADEIIDIYYDLKEEYRATATWRMNDKTEKAIRKLKDGNGNYIYAPGMNAGERPSLLGRPIVVDNYLPDLAAGNKFIVIGDFSYYQIADRGQMAIQRLNELYAATGYVGFKVWKRVDAKVLLSEAFNVGQSA